MQTKYVTKIISVTPDASLVTPDAKLNMLLKITSVTPDASCGT